MLLSAIEIFLGLGDWTVIAYFWSFAATEVLGATMETFGMKHRLVLFLALLVGLSRMLLFASVLASTLYSYPFASIGWILFVLPFEAFLPYNLLRAGGLHTWEAP